MTTTKNKVTTLFNSITKYGIIEGKEYSLRDKKLIYLFNISCIIWHFTASAIIINYLIITPTNYKGIFTHLIVMGLIVLTQVIHAKQYFNFGRFVFLLFLVLITFFASNYLRIGKFAEFYLLLVPCISSITFDNKYIITFFFALSLLCFALPNIYFKNYPNANLYSPGMICLFFCFFFMVNYFKGQNKKNEELLALERDKVLSDKIILEKQEAKLRELNQFKTHFFVNLSHEIRTPITLIKGYTSKINFEETKQENEHNLLIVNKQVAQIESILNNILDLSKLDENKLKLNKNEVSIVSFIYKHYAEFKDLFTKKNIDFTIINSIEDIMVTIDSNLLSKAINNLLNNALKFTNEFGEVSIKIFQDENLIIQVIDNGIGVPKADYEKIFDRFYQSENEITKSEGSGIGLSFTKSILEAHGFSISVNSIPNSSTIFTITIPKKYTAIHKTINIIDIPITKTKVTTTPLPISTTIPTKNETILIVDDHYELRHYLKSVLKDYKILEAENGIKALEIVKNNPVDLVLTDYMMPEMDGKELVIQLKKLHLKTPIIMLTARVDDFAKLDMLRIGVDNYMIKPFIEEELLLSITHSLKIYKNIVSNFKELTLKEQKELDEVSITFHKKIREIIESNINNVNFGVEDIAVLLNISKRTLNRRAKTILGQTTKEIIIQAKIEKARTLQLKNPEMSKIEITNAVGLNNSTYLFKTLAKTYGKHYNI